MYILIDDSGDEKIIFYYRSLNTKWVQRVFKRRGGGGVLSYLDAFLKKVKKDTSALRGIAVLASGRTFTSTRLVVTLFNTLSFALKIPVVSVREINFKKLDKIFKRAEAGQYISAQYSGPARVTLKD